MTGPSFGIRVTIDSSGAKEGAAQYVRSIEDIKRADAGRRAAVGAQLSTVEQLVNANRQLLRATEVGGVATAQAAIGSTKLTSSLQSLAFAATGLPGPLGRVAGSLGSMAIGGPVTVGVLAGIAAIGFAWDRLTAASRKAAAELKVVMDRGKQLHESQRDQKTVIEEDLERIQEAIRKTEKEMKDRLGGGLLNSLRGSFVRAFPFASSLVTGSGKEDLVAQKEAEKGHIEELRKLNNEAAKERREAALKAAREEQAWLEAQVGIMAEFLDERADRLRAAARDEQAWVKEQVENMNEFLKEREDRRLASSKEETEWLDERAKIMDEFLSERQDRLEQAARAANESRREMIRFAEEMGLLPGSLAFAANAVSDFIGKAQKSAKDYVLAAASILGSLVTGRSVGASGARGALGGAAAGFAIGAPAGGIGAIPAAIIGGLLGGIAGLFGGGKNRREDVRAYQGALGAFREQGIERTPLQQTLVELQKQFDVLRAEALRLKQPLGALTMEYIHQVEAARAAFAAQQQAFKQSLEVRALVAQGLTEEAAAAARQYEQQRELQDAVKAGYDAATIAQLTYVQGLETEAVAKRAAAAATELLNRDILAGLSLAEREAGVRGDTVGGLRARRDREYAEANRLRDTGGISAENYIRLINVIFGEFTQGMQVVAEAAEAAALAVFNYNKSMREDLDVRALVAQGQDAAAEDLRFRIAQEREYAQALRDGADAVTLVMLAWVQAAEAVARAAQKVAAEARGMESLTVRSLRATGKDKEADRAARDYARQEERRQAEKAGWSPEYLKELDRVQGQERAKEDADWYAAKQATFDREFPTTGGASQAFAAVSAVVTDRSALMLIDMQRQGVSFLSVLPKIEANTRGGGGSGGGAGGGGIHISMVNRFAKFDEQTVEEILQKLKRRLNEEFGSECLQGNIFNGDVSR